MSANRKIRLKRNLLIKGDHVEKGTVLSAPTPLAASLVGDGSAEYHEDSAAEAEAEKKSGVAVHAPHAQNADPEIRKVSGPPASPKSKSAK